jgi:hypothetical protein
MSGRRPLVTQVFSQFEITSAHSKSVAHDLDVEIGLSVAIGVAAHIEILVDTGAVQFAPAAVESVCADEFQRLNAGFDAVGVPAS